MATAHEFVGTDVPLSGLFDKAHRPILAIMAAVLVWGSLHALGAYLFEHDYRKPLVVYGFLLAFLGFWAAMLANRNHRLGKQPRDGTDRFQGGDKDTDLDR